MRTAEEEETRRDIDELCEMADYSPITLDSTTRIAEKTRDWCWDWDSIENQQ